MADCPPSFSTAFEIEGFLIMLPFYTRTACIASDTCVDTILACGSNLAMNIHERIKRGRIAKRMSMEELAEKLGVTWQAVQQWENGGTTPRRKRVEQIAQVLDMSEMEVALGKDDTKSWPFELISEAKVSRLSQKDLTRLETALLIVARDLGIDVSESKRAAA